MARNSPISAVPVGRRPARRPASTKCRPLSCRMPGRRLLVVSDVHRTRVSINGPVSVLMSRDHSNVPRTRSGKRTRLIRRCADALGINHRTTDDIDQALELGSALVGVATVASIRYCRCLGQAPAASCPAPCQQGRARTAIGIALRRNRQAGVESPVRSPVFGSRADTTVATDNQHGIVKYCRR